MSENTPRDGGTNCPTCGQHVPMRRNRRLNDIKAKVLDFIKHRGDVHSKEVYALMKREGYEHNMRQNLYRWITDHPDYRKIADEHNGSTLYYVGGF